MAATRVINKASGSAQDLYVTGVTSPSLDAISGEQAFTVGGVLICDAGLAVRGTGTVGSAQLAAGTVTVPAAGASAASQIFLSRTTPGTGNALGFLVVEAKTATNFTVNSQDATGALVAADDSSFDWWIINPSQN